MLCFFFQIERTPPSALANRSISSGTGSSIKLPDATSLLGADAANSSTPVDLQVRANCEFLIFLQTVSFLNKKLFNRLCAIWPEAYQRGSLGKSHQKGDYLKQSM